MLTIRDKGESEVKMMYYLRSKMIVPFLEFDIFWEKFVYFLVTKIALSQENVPFTKKNAPKVVKK